MNRPLLWPQAVNDFCGYPVQPSGGTAAFSYTLEEQVFSIGRYTSSTVIAFSLESFTQAPGFCPGTILISETDVQLDGQLSVGGEFREYQKITVR